MPKKLLQDKNLILATIEKIDQIILPINSYYYASLVKLKAAMVLEFLLSL